LFIINS